MKIRVEPESWSRLLNAGLLKKEIKAANLQANENRVIVADMSEGSFGAYNKFDKEYFIDLKELDSEEDEVVVLTDRLFDRMRQGFKDRWIDIETDEQNIIVLGTKERYQEGKSPPGALFNIKMDETETGIIPKGSKWSVEVKINADDIINVGDVDKYRIIYHQDDNPENEKLIMEAVTADSEYTKEVDVIEAEKTTETTLVVPQKYVEIIASLVVGEVWLRFSDEALMVSEHSENYSLNFILSAWTEE